MRREDIPWSPQPRVLTTSKTALRIRPVKPDMIRNLKRRLLESTFSPITSPIFQSLPIFLPRETRFVAWTFFPGSIIGSRGLCDPGFWMPILRDRLAHLWVGKKTGQTALTLRRLRWAFRASRFSWLFYVFRQL